MVFDAGHIVLRFAVCATKIREEARAQRVEMRPNFTHTS